MSIDGIGAFDLVAQEAMLRGLLTVEGGESALPFVRQFYGLLGHTFGKTKIAQCLMCTKVKGASKATL